MTLHATISCSCLSHSASFFKYACKLSLCGCRFFEEFPLFVRLFSCASFESLYSLNSFHKSYYFKYFLDQSGSISFWTCLLRINLKFLKQVDMVLSACCLNNSM